MAAYLEEFFRRVVVSALCLNGFCDDPSHRYPTLLVGTGNDVLGHGQTPLVLGLVLLFEVFQGVAVSREVTLWPGLKWTKNITVKEGQFCADSYWSLAGLVTNSILFC